VVNRRRIFRKTYSCNILDYLSIDFDGRGRTLTEGMLASDSRAARMIFSNSHNAVFIDGISPNSLTEGECSGDGFPGYFGSRE
jgi:hypothetical protein